MPKRCSVCEHDLREEIDRAIHRGLYTSEIAHSFGFTPPTIAGHRRSAHHLLHPRPVAGGPHTASSLLKKIEDSLGDTAAVAALRIAAYALPPAERRLFIAELRRRSGKVAEHIPARLEVA